MRSFVILAIISIILLGGCVNDANTQPHASYQVSLIKVPRTMLSIPSRHPEIYSFNGSAYFVIRFSGNGNPKINYALTPKGECLDLDIDYNVTTRTFTNYDLLFMIKTNASCIIYNKERFDASQSPECYRDEDCVHKPAICHADAQPCMPYYTVPPNLYDKVLNAKGNIVCTMECRQCISCKCVEGKCMSEKMHEGCC